jgi:hypothetical protein
MMATQERIEDNSQMREAGEVFLDMRDFFENPSKLQYLTTVLSIEEVEEALQGIEKVFLEHEDYEKCAQVKKWREVTDKKRKECTNF